MAIIEEESEALDATTPMLIPPIIPEYVTYIDADDCADEDDDDDSSSNSSLFATSPIATPMNVDDKDDDLDQERYLLKKEMHL
jgi:hypothetical protein